MQFVQSLPTAAVVMVVGGGGGVDVVVAAAQQICIYTQRIVRLPEYVNSIVLCLAAFHD